MKYIIGIFAYMTLLSCNMKTENKLPAFAFTTLEGKNITSENIKGNATIICVWATWCGDCIREIPELNDLVVTYKDNKNVNFIALSDEDETTVMKSLARFPFNFTHIINAGDYTNQIKSGIRKHFPQVLVIDKELNVVYDVTENKEKIFSVLDQHIQTILKQ